MLWSEVRVPSQLTALCVCNQPRRLSREYHLYGYHELAGYSRLLS